MKTLHINLWAGPGTGKSTMAAGIFAALKWNKIDCELVSEYAKQIVWEESYTKLNNQIYLFGKQYSKHYNLEGKVQVVITDSPIPMGCVYDAGRTKYLKELVISEFHKFDNLNYFLGRVKDYNPNGRMQSYEEALEKDREIKQFMIDNEIEYIDIPAEEVSIKLIVEDIKRKLSYETV
jgi:hypothetical protein